MAIKFWKAPEFWKAPVSRLRRWFGFDVAAAAKAKAVANGPLGDEPEDRLRGLDQALQDEIGRGVSKIYSVNLDDIRGAVGDKWSRLKTKVDLISDGVARRHTGRGSLCTVEGEDGSYTVMMVGPDSDEGRKRAVDVANDLGHRLIGAGLGDSTAKIRAFENDPREFYATSGKLNEETLPTIVRLGRELFLGDDGGAASTNQAAAAVSADEKSTGRGHGPGAEEAAAAAGQVGIAANRRRDADIRAPGVGADRPSRDGRWVTGAATAHGAPDPGRSGDRAEVTPDCGRTRERAEVAPEWDGTGSVRRAAADYGRSHDRPETIPEWESTIAAKGPAADYGRSHGRRDPETRLAMGQKGDRAPPPQAVTPKVEAVAPSIRLTYRRVWSAGSQAIDVFRCAPANQPFPLHQGDDKARLRLDIEVARAVAAELGDAPLPWPFGAAIVPVHYVSLLHSDAQKLLAALDDCATAIGRRHFRVEIIDLSPGATTERIAQATDLLRPHCPAILVRTGLAAHHLDTLKAWGATAAGADLDALNERQRTKAGLVPMLTRFAAAAGTLPVYLWGAQRPGEVLAALEAGFAMVGGPVLMPDQPAPGLPLALTRASIAAQTVKAGHW